MNRKLQPLAMCCPLLAMAAVARANASVTLSLQYIGAASNLAYWDVEDAMQAPPPAPGSPGRGMTMLGFPGVGSYSTPSPLNKYYFDVLLTFTPDAPNEAFRDITAFNVTVISSPGLTCPIQLVPIGKYSNDKWMPARDFERDTYRGIYWAPVDGDSGVPNDLTALIFQQSDPRVAYQALYGQNGPTYMGCFAVEFTNPSYWWTPLEIHLTPGPGAIFSYFVDRDSEAYFRIDPDGQSSGPNIIAGNGFSGVSETPFYSMVLIPEPSSLCLLVLPCLAILGCHRRTGAHHRCGHGIAAAVQNQ